MTTMKGTAAKYVAIRYHTRKVWCIIRGLYMKGSNTLVANVTIKQLQSQILLLTVEQYMKESNTLVGNAANISLREEIWLNT